jgi:hypothetical protein
MPQLDGEVKKVMISTSNPPRGLRMVPALVPAGRNKPLYGDRAFTWLRVQAKSLVAPYTAKADVQGGDGMEYTFLDDQGSVSGAAGAPDKTQAGWMP